MKAWLIAQRLLRQNRWLWVLLVLWPWGMAAILLVPGGGLAESDVAALLEQECFYGLALVAFTGGTLLGNESRSQRIALVLSRAVSRREYMAALWLTAWVPQVLYVLSFSLSGAMLREPAQVLLQLAGAQLALGAALASLTLMFSIVLPGIVASSLSFGAIALLYAVPEAIGIAFLPRLFIGEEVNSAAVYGTGLFEAAVGAVVIFIAASVLFRHRDLDLKSD